jgi:hypothetical protein
MKKIIPLTFILILWAVSLMGSDLPPYSVSYPAVAFYASAMADQPEIAIEIFPNPVTEGNLTIKSDENFQSVQILNITGKIVFSQVYPTGSSSEVIELNKLEKGIYLVRIGFAGKENHTEKIMIK